MTPDTRDLLFDGLGFMGVTLSVFLLLFGSWVWAQDTMSLRDAQQSQDIAVLHSLHLNLDRRVTAIEDRLFGILVTTGGAVAGSATSAIFSFRTHRRLKNGPRNG